MELLREPNSLNITGYRQIFNEIVLKYLVRVGYSWDFAVCFVEYHFQRALH